MTARKADATPTGYREILSVLDALPVIVRETRRRQALSLRRAAEVTGVSFSTICRVDNGTGDPNLASIKALLRWAAK